MRSKYGILTALTLTASILSGSVRAEESERWFDVEVIVFKNKRFSLNEEIWPEKAPILFPSNLEDFITEVLYPTPEGLVNAGVPAESTNKATDKEQGETVEGSFVLMPENEYQLSSLNGSLTRSSWYEPLAHVAWRQPVKDKAEAEWVRIVGGKNFIEEFEFNGHEIESTQAPKIQTTTLVNETFPDSQRMYQPVPEIDGSLQVYLSRYLHINTDLVIRIPGEEELDITAISNSLSSSLLELTNDGVMKEEYESSFDWSFQGDNWLDTEKQTTRVKRLLNYPLSQSRRIRSGEVHYFDHPLYGIIIQVRPYDSDANSPSNESSAGR